MLLGTPSVLVIGLGNPILGDDGVGWRVAEEVARQLSGRTEAVEVDCVALGGLSLMERMIGYGRVLLVDAIATGRDPPGTVRRFPLDALPACADTHSGSAHDTSLQTALQMGKRLGASLPDEVLIVSIETRNAFDFSETLSSEVAAAVPRAVEACMEALSTEC